MKDLERINELQELTVDVSNQIAELAEVLEAWAKELEDLTREQQ